MTIKFCALLLGTLQLVPAEQIPKKEKSPYVELILCPTKEQPWECARQQTVRLLDYWNIDLVKQWTDLKVEADTELNKTLERRGFSSNENLSEKPSSVLNKIAVGANYIQEFVETTTNELLGRQEEYDLPDSSVEEDEKEPSGGHRKKKKPQQELLLLQQHGDLDSFGNLLHGLGGHGNKLGIKLPHKYGRSVGVTRGKKKKKKVLMKIMLLATLIKGKIELLLKILSAHLQIKFFAIALIGLLINVARFWIEVKNKNQPQKVIYYENAHHQHHYEDHGEDWGGEQASGYWKRSLKPMDESSKTSEMSRTFPSMDFSNDYKDDSHTMAFRRQRPLSSS